MNSQKISLLHQAERFQVHRILADDAASGLMLIDGEGRVISMNPAAEKATGYRLEQARGRKLHDLTHHIHPDGTAYPASQCPIESALAGASCIRSLEETFIDREGRFFPVSYSMVSVYHMRAKSDAILEFRDVTERKRAEARLKRSEDRYRRLFETAQDGILILDAEEGHIADANPFLLDSLGYAREDLLGKQLWEIGLFKDRDSNQEAFRKLKEKDFIRYDDLPLKTKEGSIRAVEFVSNTYSVGDESVIQCNIRDITERRSAEKALLVSEETLRQSKKMESVGKLSGGIAHDFNNVLTAVIGYAGIAVTMAESKGALRDCLDEILKAAEQATALTGQLLAFSRQQALVPKVLGLNAIVVDMHAMLARLIGETMHIRENLDPDLGRVKADKVHIQQIIMNLVINARDSMPLGGEITITTCNDDSDGEYAALHPETRPRDYVMLSVGDAGMGMETEVMDRIFDPFFTTKDFGKGTGMGLATVQGIVDQTGGHITVESSPGKGSTFRIYLPRTQKEEESPVNAVARDFAVDQGSGTVLLVDDEMMVRTLIHKILVMHGYSVLEAGNGADALALIRARTERIDLLLTDLRMPGMNGWDLAQGFLVMVPNGHVLFMSGHAEPVNAQPGLLKEGVNFIQKPFAPSQLARAVRETLRQDALQRLDWTSSMKAL